MVCPGLLKENGKSFGFGEGEVLDDLWSPVELFVAGKSKREGFNGDFGVGSALG